MTRPHIVKEEDFEDFVPTTLLASSSTTHTRETKRMVVNTLMSTNTVVYLVTHGSKVMYNGESFAEAIEAYNDIW